MIFVIKLHFRVRYVYIIHLDGYVSILPASTFTQFKY